MRLSVVSFTIPQSSRQYPGARRSTECPQLMQSEAKKVTNAKKITHDQRCTCNIHLAWNNCADACIQMSRSLFVRASHAHANLSIIRRDYHKHTGNTTGKYGRCRLIAVFSVLNYSNWTHNLCASCHKWMKRAKLYDFDLDTMLQSRHPHTHTHIICCTLERLCLRLRRLSWYWNWFDAWEEKRKRNWLFAWKL